jgi:predicted DCC family thiol-disulfide oxidoreductase YuxK
MDTQSAAKILVYDGDCRMCTQFSRVAEKRWLVGAAERRPADSFDGDE